MPNTIKSDPKGTLGVAYGMVGNTLVISASHSRRELMPLQFIKPNGEWTKLQSANMDTLPFTTAINTFVNRKDGIQDVLFTGDVNLGYSNTTVVSPLVDELLKGFATTTIPVTKVLYSGEPHIVRDCNMQIKKKPDLVAHADTTYVVDMAALAVANLVNGRPVNETPVYGTGPSHSQPASTMAKENTTEEQDIWTRTVATEEDEDTNARDDFHHKTHPQQLTQAGLTHNQTLKQKLGDELGKNAPDNSNSRHYNPS
ncbi:hypothetical protein [Legionella taurinensis]|uniref:Uncharacterized protein n=1 Tax=Legionella taurinensis TaxID=70611 RepID=A0A3A5L6Z7_9GAMM|nr:hypothetical protein [Legionella taurinensis]RJT45227.1 hypothetical protein D6J04_10975 [Legionella taurinensis]RJT65828.1 hypothetical protein D6J03_11620 [Legionella taurinensis]STY27071.1 Uncharacterised protein [Legionella taurinensis]